MGSTIDFFINLLSKPLRKEQLNNDYSSYSNLLVNMTGGGFFLTILIMNWIFVFPLLCLFDGIDIAIVRCLDYSSGLFFLSLLILIVSVLGLIYENAKIKASELYGTLESTFSSFWKKGVIAVVFTIFWILGYIFSFIWILN